jgi:DNA-binding NtrC family response regulator
MRVASDLIYIIDCVCCKASNHRCARGGDIELLAKHVLARHGWEAARRLRNLSPCAIAAVYHYDWPRNARALINCVRRAIVMPEKRHVAAADLELGS